MDFIFNKKIPVLPVDASISFLGRTFIDDGVEIDIGIVYSFVGASGFNNNPFGQILGSIHSIKTPSGNKN